MNRREFLQCAALLVSGASASRLGFALTQEQTAYLATAPNYNTTAVDYLTPAQRRIIAALSEIVIPRTDTPGAIDAGVPRFIELMAADWFNAQERAIFDAGVEDLQTRIPAEYGSAFDELEQGDQLAIMESLNRHGMPSPTFSAISSATRLSFAR